MSAADEDTELRDLVAQTLESNGVLGKIRAQLRANVFLALEEQEPLEEKSPLLNKELQNFLNTKDGRVVTSLVREFLEHFNLDFSIAVFEPETGFGDKYEGRESLSRELNVVDNEITRGSPLLLHVLKKHKDSDSVSRTPRSASIIEQDIEDSVRIPKELTSVQIAEAKQKFQQYDTDYSGSIEKDELRKLFADMFPGFHRNMLDRYVNDEFRAVDKDFSNAIDFEEFLGMYKRLFVLCRSVVSHDISDIVPGSPRKTGEITTPSKIPAPIKKSGLNQVNNKPTSVEAKNKKNVELNSHNSSFSDNDDPFFDDTFPKPNNTSFGSRRNRIKGDKPSHIPRLSPTPGGSEERLKKDAETNVDHPKKDEEKKFDTQGKGPDASVKDTQSKIPKPSSPISPMSSLTGLPSLTGNGGGASLRNNPPLPGMTKLTEKEDKLANTLDMENDLKAIDNRIAALGFDPPKDEEDDDDYEDDFASSGNSQTHSARTHSEKSEKNNKSQKSEKSQSIGEEIDEDIEEDISIESQSGLEDLTTDHTLSGAELSADYMEDVITTS